MVNTSFICEDDAGKKIVDSSSFRQLLVVNEVNLVLPIHNAMGKGNLSQENISGLINKSIDNGAKHIFVLVDLDDDSCITNTKQNLIQQSNCNIIVCKRAIEAWFLADTQTLSALFKRNAHFENPENPSVPYDVINQMHKEAFNGRGVSKAILPIKLLGLGFTVEKAAGHANCPSARYLLEKIKTLKNQ